MKVLKFYTETCMPCKVVGKILESMDLDVDSIDAMKDIKLVDEYNICTTPTLIFLDDEGTEFARTVGPVTKEKISKIIEQKK